MNKVWFLNKFPKFLNKIRYIHQTGNCQINFVSPITGKHA